MMELKVYCDCGQKYKFDVEPVNGRMPYTVACPICKRDGTAKANEMLQQMAVFRPVGVESAAMSAAISPPPIPVHAAASVNVAPPPVPRTSVIAAPAGTSAHIAVAPTPSTTLNRPAPRGLQVDPAQVEAEARAKILWGDRPEEVITFFLLRGFSNEDATEKVHAMLKERNRTIRAKGMVKTIGGSVLTLGSAGALFGLLRVGFFSPFVLGLNGLAIVMGLWILFNGLWKLLMPGAQSGDASDND